MSPRIPKGERESLRERVEAAERKLNPPPPEPVYAERIMPREDAKQMCYFAALLGENEAAGKNVLDGMSDSEIAELDRLMEMLPSLDIELRFTPELVEEAALERGLEAGASPELHNPETEE